MQQHLTALVSVFVFLVVIISGIPATAGPITDGLVAHYKLDGIPDPVIDFAGSNNGSNNGATHSQPGADAAPEFGNSFAFDGSDDSVTISNSLDISTSISISLWMNVHTSNNSFGSGIVSKRNTGTAPGDDAFQVSFHDGKLEAYLWGTSATVYSTDSDFVVLNEWIHAVVTYDGAAVKIYKDGVEKLDFAATGNILNLNFPTIIGHDRVVGYFDGNLDDIGIWNRALTAGEVNFLSQNPIPEPNTALLLGFGLVGLGVKRRRAVLH